METTTIKLDQILIDPQFQVRKDIDTFWISKLVQVLLTKGKFDEPIVVSQEYTLLSGFHRYKAYRRIFSSQDNIEVKIYHAETDEDAYRFAVKANSSHGLALKECDKQIIRDKLQTFNWSVH